MVSHSIPVSQLGCYSLNGQTTKWVKTGQIVQLNVYRLTVCHSPGGLLQEFLQSPFWERDYSPFYSYILIITWHSLGPNWYIISSFGPQYNTDKSKCHRGPPRCSGGWSTQTAKRLRKLACTQQHFSIPESMLSKRLSQALHQGAKGKNKDNSHKLKQEVPGGLEA